MNEYQSILVSVRLKKDKSFTVSLSGKCMEPLFKAGDSVQIKKCDDYETGNICFLRTENGELLFHRIVGTVEYGYITKGDRAKKYEFTPRNNILGTVMRVRRSESNVMSDFCEGHVRMKIKALLSRQYMRNYKHPSVYVSVKEIIAEHILFILNSFDRWRLQNNHILVYR